MSGRPFRSVQEAVAAFQEIIPMIHSFSAILFDVKPVLHPTGDWIHELSEFWLDRALDCACSHRVMWGQM